MKIKNTILGRFFFVIIMTIICAGAVSALSWQKSGSENMNLDDYGNLWMNGNLTVSEKITFGFGEVIDNIVNGWVRVTGNLNVTGNVAVQGSSLTVNGHEVCLDDGTNCVAGNDGKGGDNNYLYNDSTKMYFNETKLNATIDARADVDTDTHVAGDDNYLTNNSVTMFFNETKLNATIDDRSTSTDTNCSVDGSCSSVTYDSETSNWDKDTSNDVNTTTNFGGDISGTYNNIQIGSDTIGDNEINYSAVTLNDFTDDVGYTEDDVDETISGRWTFNDDVIMNKNLLIVGNITNVAVSNLNINGTLFPALHNQFDLGTSANRWKDLFLQGDAYIAGTLFATNLNGLLHWDNITNKPANLDIDSTDDLTTSTSFGGDVSGTYNAIVVADDSHTHDWANITNVPSGLDTDTSNDVNTTTNFGGDVSGTYNNIQLGTDVVGDNELNYSAVTLSDFTDDANYMNSTEVATSYVPYTGATGDVNLGSNDLTTTGIAHSGNLTVGAGNYKVYYNGTETVIEY